MAPISGACPSISDSGHVQHDEGSRRLPRKRSRRMEKDEYKKACGPRGMRAAAAVGGMWPRHTPLFGGQPDVGTGVASCKYTHGAPDKHRRRVKTVWRKRHSRHSPDPDSLTPLPRPPPPSPPLYYISFLIP